MGTTASAVSRIESGQHATNAQALKSARCGPLLELLAVPVLSNPAEVATASAVDSANVARTRPTTWPLSLTSRSSLSPGSVVNGSANCDCRSRARRIRSSIRKDFPKILKLIISEGRPELGNQQYQRA